MRVRPLRCNGPTSQSGRPTGIWSHEDAIGTRRECVQLRWEKVSRIRRLALFFLIAATLVVETPAGAITIDRVFVSPGESFPFFVGGTGGNPPVNVAGGGDVVEIFNLVADWWELALQDAHTVKIYFGWDSLSGALLGEANTFTSVVPPQIGVVRFNNDGFHPFFNDMTPGDSSEYDLLTLSEDNLGGGMLNTGRVYSDAVGDAAGRYDLLTVAQHEIGHILGLLNYLGNFTVPTLEVSLPRPYPGTQIPTTSTGGGHLDVSTAVMFGNIGPGIRKLSSGVDILAIGQTVDYQWLDLNPLHIPEPATFVLAAIAGLWMFTVLGRRYPVT